MRERCRLIEIFLPQHVSYFGFRHPQRLVRLLIISFCCCCCRPYTVCAENIRTHLKNRISRSEQKVVKSISLLFEQIQIVFLLFLLAFHFVSSGDAGKVLFIYTKKRVRVVVEHEYEWNTEKKSKIYEIQTRKIFPTHNLQIIEFSSETFDIINLWEIFPFPFHSM